LAKRTQSLEEQSRELDIAQDIAPALGGALRGREGGGVQQWRVLQ